MSNAANITTKRQPLPFDPNEGSSHPPPPSPPGNKGTAAELLPVVRWMRGAMVREFVRQLKRKQKSEKQTAGVRSRKRKAALALSATVMTLSPAAIPYNHSVSPAALSMSADATQVRVNAVDLSVSESMKEALAEEEGVRLTVYRDVAGYPTVGVGHLVRPQDGLKVGQTISYQRALEFLESDLKHAELAVKRLVSELSLYQHEFDALVDLVYNVGEGNVSESESPKLNAAIALNDYEGIAEQLHYHHAAGAKAKGLVYRSQRRQAIFMDAAYHDPRPHEISVSGNVSA